MVIRFEAAEPARRIECNPKMGSCLTNVTFAFDDETNLSAHKVIRQK